MSASVPPSSQAGTVNKEGRTVLQYPAWKVALASHPLKASPVTVLTLIWETGKHRGATCLWLLILGLGPLGNDLHIPADGRPGAECSSDQASWSFLCAKASPSSHLHQNMQGKRLLSDFSSLILDVLGSGNLH